MTAPTRQPRTCVQCRRPGVHGAGMIRIDGDYRHARCCSVSELRRLPLCERALIRVSDVSRVVMEALVGEVVR